MYYEKSFLIDLRKFFCMLSFVVQSNNNNNIEVEFETIEMKILLDIMEQQKRNCSKSELKTYETLYNKIKALCIFDKLPDERSIKQIKDILLSSNNITKDNMHNVKLEKLQFSKKTFNCLNRANVQTLGELLCYTEEDLLRIRNLGIQSLNEIVDTLKKHNLELPIFTNK